MHNSNKDFIDMFAYLYMLAGCFIYILSTDLFRSEYFAGWDMWCYDCVETSMAV